MKKRLSLSAVIFMLVTAILMSFMTGYIVSNSYFKSDASEVYGTDSGTGSSSESSTSAVSGKLATIISLIKTYSYYELDDEEICTSLLDGFESVTGDRYAHYYDAETYASLVDSNQGKSVGIGISVIYDTDNECILVVSVYPDSPALEAGLKTGDRIVTVGTGSSAEKVSDIGYDLAITRLRGEEGTLCEFSVLRDGKSIDFSITRAQVTALSVNYHVCETDTSVGIIKITGFDLTTPPQFRTAMDTLIASGCSYFIFDLRYNPGGDLASITAVLSLLLNKDDIIIRTEDRSGEMSVTAVKAVQNTMSGYSTCDITEEDIGKYRDAVVGKSAVLVNGSTASAAELFTAAIRDYKLAVTVGETTYGKGSMQTTFNLGYFGYDGALKLTTKKYYPPLGDCYDGIGITPDVTEEPDAALEGKNIYIITDAEDNVLQTAIKQIKK